MGDDNSQPAGTVSEMSLENRRPAFATWVMTVTVSTTDGYRNQKGSFELDGGWTETKDSATCVENLALTAAGLIRAVQASGLPVYGGDAIKGFAEGYWDEASIP
jgi:hypothetical protein